MATLREQLEGKTSDEKAVIKARWFSELPTRTFSRGVYDVTLSNFSAIDKTFSVFVVVTKNGQEVLRDEFRFVNPPILVADGTFRQELDEATGEMMTMPNMKEDAVEALKQLLIDAIKTQL